MHVAGYTLILFIEMNIAYVYGLEYWKTACLSVNSGLEGDVSKGADFGEVSTAVNSMKEDILPPDINESQLKFVAKNGKVLYALKPIIGLGTDNIEEIIKELKEIMTLLKNDYDNPKLDFIKENYSWVLYLDSRVDSRNIPKNSECNELVKPYVDEITNFYKRFTDYLEKMMINGKKNGFELITFIGP